MGKMLQVSSEQFFLLFMNYTWLHILSCLQSAACTWMCIFFVISALCACLLKSKLGSGVKFSRGQIYQPLYLLVFTPSLNIWGGLVVFCRDVIPSANHCLAKDAHFLYGLPYQGPLLIHWKGTGFILFWLFCVLWERPFLSLNILWYNQNNIWNVKMAWEGVM